MKVPVAVFGAAPLGLAASAATTSGCRTTGGAVGTELPTVVLNEVHTQYEYQVDPIDPEGTTVAHTIDEYVPIDGLVSCAQGLAVAAMRFCGLS